MKRKLLVPLLLLAGLLQVCWSQQNASPRQLLDAALTAVGSEDSWRSAVVTTNLRTIVTNHSSSAEFATARVLLVSHLMEKGAANDYVEALTLANIALAVTPVSWRSAWVAVDKAAILGFQNNVGALQAAGDALPIVDAAAIGQVSDPDFVRLLAVTGAQRSDLRDGVLSMIATHLIQQGSLAEADTYINQVVDAKRRAKLQRLRNRPGP